MVKGKEKRVIVINFAGSWQLCCLNEFFYEQMAGSIFMLGLKSLMRFI